MEFFDTDQAGIVHFSRFFLFMESAEHEYLRSIGTGVVSEHNGVKISFPRLAASCEYKSPAHFEDLLDIEVRVLRKGTKSITWGFRFEREGRLLATGKITTVCCRAEPGQPLESIPIPSDIADRLESPTPQAAGPDGSADNPMRASAEPIG